VNVVMFIAQTLFDAHFLATIARQHQGDHDTAMGRAAAASPIHDAISSVDSALAALTDKLRQRLDVVVYRSVAVPLPDDCCVTFVIQVLLSPRGKCGCYRCLPLCYSSICIVQTWLGAVNFTRTPAQDSPELHSFSKLRVRLPL
jgi:hypothetical protein